MSQNNIIMLLLILSPVFVMFMHIVFIYILKLCKKDVSNQLSLILTILFLNFPIVLAVYILNKTISSAIYAFIVYNCLAYSYFHFFNMSETARRIRILLEIRAKNYITYDDLTSYYKSNYMIINRINRLIGLNQVKKLDNRYILSGKILLIAAIIINKWKKILGLM